MKKNLFIMLVCVILSLLLCGCSLIPNRINQKENNSSKIKGSEQIIDETIASTEVAITIEEAKNLFSSGDYVEAIKMISEKITQVGEDKELSDTINYFEKEYVSIVINEVDQYIDSGNFDAAENTLESAKKLFPKNDLLSDKSITIENNRPVYLLNKLSPYKTPYQYDDSSIIRMGGKDYSHGFTCMGYGDKPYGNEVYFNLDGTYSSLSFIAGIVEDSGTVRFSVYTDSELTYSFEMEGGDLPSEHIVDITGCKQLVFSIYDGRSVAMYSGTYGIAEICVTP